jgi:RNA polymerase sigma-70 factor (ECF subfamily)
MSATASMTSETLAILTPIGDDATESEDRSLALSAARGNREAFTTLVRRTQGPVFGLCYRLLSQRDAAADAAQETFARAFGALSSFDADQRFDLWVMRIARNHCYDLLRRRGYQPEPDDEAAAAAVDLTPSVHERLEEAERARDLETAMERLSPRDREVLALYYVQKRKTKEIAVVLGVAPGTVMARLFRARERLRRFLEELPS